MKLHKTRREQIEQELLRNLIDELGEPFLPSQMEIIKDCLMRVAMIGAAAERQRTLELTRGIGYLASIQRITEQSVFEVLGYPESNEQLAAPAGRKGK